jgi:hypothetical protein
MQSTKHTQDAARQGIKGAMHIKAGSTPAAAAISAEGLLVISV